MLHDASAVVDGFSALVETPKPSFSQPLSSSFIVPTTTTTNHAKPSLAAAAVAAAAECEWDWAKEQADRRREAKADSAVHGAPPFHVDRNVLRDVIREKMDCRVGRIEFLSSGTCVVISPPPSPSFFPFTPMTQNTIDARPFDALQAPSIKCVQQHTNPSFFPPLCLSWLIVRPSNRRTP